MWILPKQLHTLDSVQDTEALSLDLQESSQLCAQSLFVRSKPSPLRTWLQKWKRDSWSQHLYGRILKPSLGKAFETEWTSLLEATPANHSPQQESEQERKIHGTCGLGSQTEFGFCAPDSVSSRMSKDISRWDSPASSATWKSWVTRCRGEYSARVKSAHRTSASASLSWPTTAARDWKGCGNAVTRKDGKHRLDTLEAVVMYGQANWPTPAVMDTTGGSYKTEWKDGRAVSYHNHTKENPVAYGAKLADAVKHGLPAPASSSTDGSRLESWATPNNFCFQPPENTQQWTKRAAYQQTEKGVNLHKPIQSQVLHENEKVMGAMPPSAAKLNPRWVETLMGLPVGWVMPSCTRPVIIAPMNCDCLGTESSQPPQNEHLEH